MESPNKRLIQAWLDLQCTMIQGAVRGAVIVGDGQIGASDPVALWPAKTMVTAPMLAAGRDALEQQRQVIEAVAIAAGSDIAHGCDVIATPIAIDGRPIGAVVIEMTARMQQRQEAALQVLAWGATWLESVIEHLNAGPTLRLNIVVETIAEAVKHDAFGAAAAAVANALGRLLDCSRVAVGFRDGTDIEVAAVSNTARFEQRTNLVRSVAAAMGEAIDQDRRISLPDGNADGLVVRHAHQHHRGEFGAREVHSLPFSDAGELAGAVTLERADEQFLGREDIALAETVVGIVGPILRTKRDAQLPLLLRARRALTAELHRFTEPGHLTFKLGVSVLATAFLLAFIVRVDYHVKADATLLGQVQRAVIAPYDGFVADAPVRAGDVVASGTTMVSLEDRELALERAKWKGELGQLAKERREALARRDRAKLAIIRAQMDQAEAGLALADEKLARARVKAPIEGVVVTGDLSQSLGAPVKRGCAVPQPRHRTAARLRRVDRREPPRAVRIRPIRIPGRRSRGSGPAIPRRGAVRPDPVSPSPRSQSVAV